MVLDPSLSGALVGYALSRSYGNAVHRNRLRRQLRVLVNAHEAQFRPGIYVFGASPRAKDTAFGTLDSHLSSLLGKLAGVAA